MSQWIRNETDDAQRRAGDIAERLIEATRALMPKALVTPGGNACSADEWGKIGFTIETRDGDQAYRYRVFIDEEVNR